MFVWSHFPSPFSWGRALIIGILSHTGSTDVPRGDWLFIQWLRALGVCVYVYDFAPVLKFEAKHITDVASQAIITTPGVRQKMKALSLEVQLYTPLSLSLPLSLPPPCVFVCVYRHKYWDSLKCQNHSLEAAWRNSKMVVWDWTII